MVDTSFFFLGRVSFSFFFLNRNNRNQNLWAPPESAANQIIDDRIYFNNLSVFGDIVQRNRFFALRGFDFCSSLDNSLFDSTTYVYELNNSAMGANPNKTYLVDLIDKTASANFEYLLHLNEKLPKEVLLSYIQILLNCVKLASS